MIPNPTFECWGMARIIFGFWIILSCLFIFQMHNQGVNNLSGQFYKLVKTRPPVYKSKQTITYSTSTPNQHVVELKLLKTDKNHPRYIKNFTIIHQEIPFPRDNIKMFDESGNKSVEYKLVYDKDYGLYLIDEKLVIWTFWDYNPMPSYIQVFIATINCFNRPHGIKYIIVTDEFFRENFPEHIPPYFDRMHYANRADIVRGYLLLYFGGMWMDADTFGLKSVRHIFDYLRKGHDMFSMDWRPEKNAPIGIGILGPVKAQSPLYKTWYWEVKKVLAEQEAKWNAYESAVEEGKSPDLPSMGWNWFLGAILNPVSKRLEKENIERTSPFLVKLKEGPRTWGQLMKYGGYMQQRNKFEEKVLPQDFVDPVSAGVITNDTELLFITSHSAPQRLASMSLSQYLDGRTFLAQWHSHLLCKCLKHNKDYYAK